MASCQRFGVEPIRLGWEQPWVGFGRKTLDIRRAIDDLPDDALVLSVDPFDVVFLTDLDELAARYQPYHGKYVCGSLKLGRGLAAVYNTEFNKSGQRVPHTEFGYDHLNTGTWMANAACARSVIDRLVEQEKMTDKDMDQERMTKMYIRGDAEVALDWRCDLFHNLLGLSDPQAKPDRPRVRERWFFDHTPPRGPGRACSTPRATRAWKAYARALDYPAEVSRPAQSQKNFTRKATFPTFSSWLRASWEDNRCRKQSRSTNPRARAASRRTCSDCSTENGRCQEGEYAERCTTCFRSDLVVARFS